MKYLIGLISFLLIGLLVSKKLAKLPDNQEVNTDTDFILVAHPPEAVANLLRQQCYNCHANQTIYPPEAQYAPFHKKYIEPVQKGREKLNFSTWTTYPVETQKILLLLSVEQLANKTMPLNHIFPQGNDTLTQKDGALLMHWLAQEGEAGM